MEMNQWIAFILILVLTVRLFQLHCVDFDLMSKVEIHEYFTYFCRKSKFFTKKMFPFDFHSFSNEQISR